MRDWSQSFVAALLSGIPTTLTVGSCMDAPPTPKQALRVVPQPAAMGEPTALLGSHKIICARRADKPVACAGRIPFSLKPSDADSIERPINLRHNSIITEQPWSIQNLEIKKIVGTESRTCALLPDGEIRCWPPGKDSRSYQSPPWTEPSVDFDVDRTICAITKSSTVRCRSLAPCGEQTGASYTVDGITRPTSLVAGFSTSCASQSDGKALCWRKYDSEDECSPKARLVPGIENAVSLHGFEDAFCALTENNTVHCWGDNRLEMLGVGRDAVAASITPIEVEGLPPVVKLAASRGTVVALTTEGDVWAWGRILQWDKSNTRPKQADGIERAIDIFAGDGQGCALLSDHEIRCFGRGLRSRATGKAKHHAYEDKREWIEAQQYVLWEDPP